MEKEFKGKAIYNPKGKAKEYSKWACNFYVGCSNGCKYCYLKKGRNKKYLGGDKPKLKACFKSEEHAIDVFRGELLKNKQELRKQGLFFTFTSDNLLPESILLLQDAIDICFVNGIPVKILTKTGLNQIEILNRHCVNFDIDKSKIAIGYTLTDHDELEPFAAPNFERIKAMRFAKENGFKTFASIEPIIDFQSSKRMIEFSVYYCDLFKVGLESGKKYSKEEGMQFIEWLSMMENKIYLKESLQKLTGYNNDLADNFVNSDYNLFE